MLCPNGTVGPPDQDREVGVPVPDAAYTRRSCAGNSTSWFGEHGLRQNAVYAPQERDFGVTFPSSPCCIQRPMNPWSPASMNPLSPARRVRRTFMRLAQSISIIAFLVMAGDILFWQWIAGHATASFIFGTACYIAAACTALFAIIVGIGLVASSAFSDEPPGMGPEQPER